MTSPLFPGLLIEAHRGASADAPENTLASFRRGVDAGAGSFELDVQLTRDGEVLVMHDATVDRTTDGTGRVCDLDRAQIRRLDAGAWFGAEFAGEPVPTLAQALDLAHAAGVAVNVEAKAHGETRALAERVAVLLRAAGRAGHGVVSSFDVETLLAVREFLPDACLGVIGAGPDVVDAALVHGFAWVHLHFRRVNRDLVARAHAAGVRVMIWTLDDPALGAHYARLGVDKICTNRPDRFVLCCAPERGARSGRDSGAPGAGSQD